MDQMSGPIVGSPTLPPDRVLNRQGRGGVMFWTAIIDYGSIRPFRIENDMKIDSQAYYVFLNKHFLT